MKTTDELAIRRRATVASSVLSAFDLAGEMTP